MDQRHKQLLKKHRTQLLEINTEDVVVDYLFQEEIISGDEKDVICQKPTPEKRSRALLDILPRKGVEAFGALLVALRREGVTKRHRELAYLLDQPAPATSGSSSSSKKATSTSGSEPVKPTTAKPTTAKPTTAKPTSAKPTTAKPTTAKPTASKPTADAKKPAAGSHPHLLEPPAPASSGSSSSSSSSSKKNSGSEPVKSATAKPTAGAKKPVQAAKGHPPKPVSSGDPVSGRGSTYSVNNSDLGTCPKCAVGELTLRKYAGGTRYKIGCSNFDGGCNGVITFPDFVTDVSPARRNCKCGKIKVVLKFKRGKAPGEMMQGYKGCIDGNCNQSIVMQRKGWTIPKTGGGGSSKAMGGAMSLTGNGGATSPGMLPAGTNRCTIDAANPSCLCHCGKLAVRLQTKKEGANRGRWFHKCATGKCKFYWFEDEHLHDMRTPSSSQQLRATSRSSSQSLSSGSGSLKASGRGLKRSWEDMNGGGGDGDSTPKRKPPTCIVCKKPGHTKSKCPSTSSAQ